MFKALFLLFSTFIGLMHPTYSSEFSHEDGFQINGFSGSKNALFRFQIERDFSLKTKLSRLEVVDQVSKAIDQANPRHDGLSVAQAHSLSHELVKVAGCYGVDPAVFTSLIWRESNFRPRAVSETGASGLTQMTRQGIQEVLERLNPISNRRLGYLRTLAKKCNPEFFERVPVVISADTLAAWKNSVSHSNTDALVMGALLLKINLASVGPRTEKLNRVTIYQAALEKYNGDPKIKVQFAQDVLMLSKRMIALPEVALNDSKFLSQIQGL